MAPADRRLAMCDLKNLRETQCVVEVATNYEKSLLE